MNWDDPVARAALIDRVGPDEYNRQIGKHREDSAVARINGYRIRPVTSARWGRMFVIDDTDRAFRDLEVAKRYAATQPSNT